jgi:hypothetical protein
VWGRGGLVLVFLRAVIGAAVQAAHAHAHLDLRHDKVNVFLSIVAPRRPWPVPILFSRHNGSPAGVRRRGQGVTVDLLVGVVVALITVFLLYFFVGEAVVLLSLLDPPVQWRGMMMMVLVMAVQNGVWATLV